MYEITIHRKAKKYIAKMDKRHQSAVVDAINGLAQDCHPSNSIPMKGDDRCRLRIGAYRVIYSIFTKLEIIEVDKVSPRGGAYSH